MTTSKPPKYLSSIFNSYFYKEVESVSLTEDQADLRYLKKNITDTATALETFSGGIKTNTIDGLLSTDTSNILINSTGNINIGTSSSRTIANPILIGNTNNTIVRIGTNLMQFSTVGSPKATLALIDTSGISIITATAAFSFLSNQTGALSIATAINRTGDINIANTQTSGTGNIVIGSTALTTGSQNIQINRPLTIGYTVNPTSLSQIGGTSFLNGLAQPFPSTGGSLTLAVLNSIPIGIYQVFYNISTEITVATATLTERITTISDRSADTALANVFNFMINSDLLHQTRIVGHNFTITGGGIFVNTTANISIYLNQRFIYASGPTVNVTGHLRIVRIG